MTKVEAVINSRHLTVETVSGSNSLVPFAPSNTLTMKTSVVMPPPGTFQEHIYTVREDGDVFNTIQVNFGQDGEKNSWQICKLEWNGMKLEKILKLVT